LTKTLKARETAIARLEEKIAALTERNGHLEADIQVSCTNIEKWVEDLNAALQRERMERAVVEGALEAARKDNFRLQSEVAALRSTLRRGASLEDAPVRPSEAANDEAPPKGKKGKNVEHSQKAGSKA
jgi:crescentin